MEGFVLNLLNGLSWGMLLFLISVGLTTVFGVMGILNFAHGSFYMLGAYFCLEIMKYFNSFWIGLIVAPLFVAILGFIMEKTLLNKIYARDVIFQLLLTFAILLILDDSVRFIWGPGYHVINPPDILSGSVKVFTHSYPVYRFFLIILGPVVAVILWGFFHFTKAGKIIRAVASDREMAEGVGLNAPLVFSLVFAFGCWLAGLGGALASPIESVAPSMGEKIIIESFIVVVIGGMGSFPGAFIGALILGLVESFGTNLIGEIQMAIPYLVLAIILLVKPTGLFGKKIA